MNSRYLRLFAAAFALLACTQASPATTSSAASPANATTTPTVGNAYLFSYFTRNGEDGVHLAYSRNGINWLPLNGGKSVITPAISGAGRGWQEWDNTASLMRDPSIIQGPDGMFHMVWTVSWNDHSIGVAHSRDLIHWSEQTKVPVMEHEPNALNTWAPDLFYDDAKKEFVIVWATSIPGRFPATDSLAQKTSRGRADHRLYYTTTKDFKSFAKGKLLYDGGFCAIDGTEGPSVLHTGGYWYVYYDEYTKGHYGAMRTRDFKTWEPFSDSLQTPRGIRHGSAFLATESVLRGLMALDSTGR